MPESLGTITVKLGDPVTKRLVATWQEAFKEQERKVAGLLAESNARADAAEREVTRLRGIETAAREAMFVFYADYTMWPVDQRYRRRADTMADLRGAVEESDA